MFFYFLYETTNIVNGKIYRGKHSTKNIDDGYLGSGLLLSRAIKKYGKQNFTRRIVQYFNSESELNEAEKQFITEDFVELTANYNLAIGGQGGAHVASFLKKGKTKQNDHGRFQQSIKIAGENNPSKRFDVKAKLSEASAGSNNAMFGIYGEKHHSAKLTDLERLTIIHEFESGKTRRELYDKYKNKVAAITIKKIIADREKIKKRLLNHS